jgi:hypothetical protein
MTAQKNLFTIFLITAVSAGAFAQESMETVMEKRAREMHRIICLSDKDQWRKFITENYTQALIDRPMRATIQEGDQTAKTTETKSPSNIDAKVGMFERLHNDFGGSKVVSIKTAGETLNMTLNNGEGMTGIFQLKFDKNKPYLIDGLGIRAEN